MGHLTLGIQSALGAGIVAGASASVSTAFVADPSVVQADETEFVFGTPPITSVGTSEPNFRMASLFSASSQIQLSLSSSHMEGPSSSDGIGAPPAGSGGGGGDDGSKVGRDPKRILAAMQAFVDGGKNRVGEEYREYDIDINDMDTALVVVESIIESIKKDDLHTLRRKVAFLHDFSDELGGGFGNHQFRLASPRHNWMWRCIARRLMNEEYDSDFYFLWQTVVTDHEAMWGARWRLIKNLVPTRPAGQSPSIIEQFLVLFRKKDESADIEEAVPYRIEKVAPKERDALIWNVLNYLHEIDDWYAFD